MILQVGVNINVKPLFNLNRFYCWNCWYFDSFQNIIQLKKKKFDNLPIFVLPECMFFPQNNHYNFLPSWVTFDILWDVVVPGSSTASPTISAPSTCSVSGSLCRHVVQVYLRAERETYTPETKKIARKKKLWHNASAMFCCHIAKNLN